MSSEIAIYRTFCVCVLLATTTTQPIPKMSDSKVSAGLKIWKSGDKLVLAASKKDAIDMLVGKSRHRVHNFLSNPFMEGGCQRRIHLEGGFSNPAQDT